MLTGSVSKAKFIESEKPAIAVRKGNPREELLRSEYRFNQSGEEQNNSQSEGKDNNQEARIATRKLEVYANKACFNNQSEN